MTLPQRQIGSFSVSAIGLGAMPMSMAGRDVPEDQAIATIHAALDAGITLIDTADAYTPDPDQVGHNERLVAKALNSYGDTAGVVVATKGGHTRTPDGGWGQNGSPDYLRQACEASLRALGVDAIDIYQYHRPDPAVAYEDSLGALSDLLAAGKIRSAGISNADPDQIGLAQKALGKDFVSVQNQLSPSFRTSEPELDYCTDHDIAFLPWSPLGGTGSAGELGSSYSAFAELGREHGVSAQQVCLAWLLAKSRQVVPIPGASRPETIQDSAAAANLSLSADEVARLDATG